MGNFRLLFQKISFYLGSSFSTQIRQHLKISFGIFVASILITQIISIQYVTLILYFCPKNIFMHFFSNISSARFKPLEWITSDVQSISVVITVILRCPFHWFQRSQSQSFRQIWRSRAPYMTDKNFREKPHRTLFNFVPHRSACRDWRQK